mmetsp:Transcript_7543/g.34157  ORF Transcript_7543/g.34157 Transcript_7543/m.34157 type:complete len:217 (-) Transcript_7543:3421-4071(-)
MRGGLHARDYAGGVSPGCRASRVRFAPVRAKVRRRDVSVARGGGAAARRGRVPRQPQLEHPGGVPGDVLRSQMGRRRGHQGSPGSRRGGRAVHHPRGPAAAHGGARGPGWRGATPAGARRSRGCHRPSRLVRVPLRRQPQVGDVARGRERTAGSPGALSVARRERRRGRRRRVHVCAQRGAVGQVRDFAFVEALGREARCGDGARGHARARRRGGW